MDKDLDGSSYRTTLPMLFHPLVGASRRYWLPYHRIWWAYLRAPAGIVHKERSGFNPRFLNAIPNPYSNPSPSGQGSLSPMPGGERTPIDIRLRAICTFLWVERSLMVRGVGLVRCFFPSVLFGRAFRRWTGCVSLTASLITPPFLLRFSRLSLLIESMTRLGVSK